MKLTPIYENLSTLKKTNRGQIEIGDVVKKITTDKIEYENALRLIKRPNKHFIKYFSAEPYEDNSWLLTMEPISELSEPEWNVIDLILNSLGRQDYMLDNNRRYSLINELKANPEWYEDYGPFNKVLSLINSLYGMYLYAHNNGFVLYDLRPQNLGRTNDGRLVHFDLGSG